MRITMPAIEVKEGDGFKNDKLGRAKFGQSLMNLILNVEEELVIALDAPWGEGKTTFVKMWQGLLTKNKINSIYIDAFANDYIDDPFIAIASEIIVWAEENKPKRAKALLTRFKKNATTIGSKLLPLATRLGVKAVTLNIVDAQDIEEIKAIGKDIASISSEAAEKIIKERINSHKRDILTIESFKSTLAAIAKQENEENKPLVIIIDELDRCKPTYALKLIEHVKHLFLTKGVVFVLSINKQMIEEVVRGVYGSGIDANNYLQKFITLEVRIPKKDNRIFVGGTDFDKYSSLLIKELGIKIPHADSFLPEFAKYYNLSLREIEKCASNLALITAIANMRYSVPILWIFLSVIKIKKPKTFSLIREKHNNLSIIKSELTDGNSKESIFLGEVFEWIDYCILNKEPKEARILEKIKDIEFNDQIRREDILSFHCALIEMFMYPE